MQCNSGVEWLNGSIGLNDDWQIVQQHSMMIYANIIEFGCAVQWLDGLIVMYRYRGCTCTGSSLGSVLGSAELNLTI